ncbi:MAG: GGDEF domain-containing protein [Chloracidobacterium sp.]|nr:GGDEF domain-containing protein [Chloracidobacterium sp.]
MDKAVRSFKSVHAQGENAEKLTNIETPLDAGLAGRCFESRMVQIERGVSGFNELIPVEALSGFRSAAAIPLVRSGEVFAVITLYSDSRTAFDGSAITTLEAIGERIAPLVLSSLSFEQSLSNALTDPVTHLPNERAFHLILENQIAETQRNPENRPLTVLALDIREFDQFNLKYGHVAGDRVLSLVANTVKSQLRQMDFFARASNDEFFAILPTANEAIAHEVISRINTSLLRLRSLLTITRRSRRY